MLTIIIALPTISLVMTSYVYAGEVITSLTYITVLLVRQRVFGIHNQRYLVQQVILVQFFIMVILLICLSVIDQRVNQGNNNRTFLDSLYFSMVTISTVGFGDFFWSSEQCYRAGVHILFFSTFCFIFCMGTVASTITQISLLIAAHSKKAGGSSKKQEKLGKDICNIPDKNEPPLERRVAKRG